jgi:hypothetical protein
VFAVGVVLGTATGGTLAAFSGTSTNAGNAFSAAPDWEAPSGIASVIAKTSGGSGGSINPGSTYYVYANVSDTGNPPSGISSVTADVSTITPGETAAPLTTAPCPCTVDATTYSYRSGSITADSGLATGTYSYSITATDGAGNATTQGGFTVSVTPADTTPPAGADIQTANGGATAGQAEQNDTVAFTFTETMDPNSILAGWTGASTSVVVRISNGGGGNDVLQVWNAGNTAQLPLGSMDLGRKDYVTVSRTFGAAGTASTMIQSGSVITITLGTASGVAGTAAGTGTMTWTPSATATDPAGNACSTAPTPETGAADAEF